MSQTFKATVRSEVTPTSVVQLVYLSGRLDIESVESFRWACQGRLRGQKILLNMEHVSFVGSTGIVPFLETLTELSRDPQSDLRFCRVGIEFRRIMGATPLRDRPLFDDEVVGVASFQFAAAAITAPLHEVEPGAIENIDLGVYVEEEDDRSAGG